jgi:hypothetical protein
MWIDSKGRSPLRRVRMMGKLRSTRATCPVGLTGVAKEVRRWAEPRCRGFGVSTNHLSLRAILQVRGGEGEAQSPPT